MGFHVLAFERATEALDVFKGQKEDIELAILDIQMPDMDGARLITELKSLKPDLKVIVSSGYDIQTALGNTGDYHPDCFIQKPYRRTILEDKVRYLLHPRGNATGEEPDTDGAAR